MRAHLFIGLILGSLLVALVAGCGDDDVVGGADTNQPLTSCTTDDQCNDGLTCTTDRCLDPDESGLLRCVWAVVADTCFINGICAIPGQSAAEVRGGSPCEVCDPTSPSTWTKVDDERSCDDGNACTTGDLCRLGVCAGVAVNCDDGNDCTGDRCDPVSGCVSTPQVAFTCDDGVRCTIDDRCDALGVCAGKADTCDDDDGCTTDACNEVEGCTHAPRDGMPCDVGDACSEALCRAGACTVARPVSCDDGNACTIDTCDDVAGCVHLPTLSPCCIGAVSVCDDGNACTDDACDPSTGACSQTNNTSPCNDSNACTSGDQCAEGACQPGATLACDDGNPCTQDACNPSLAEPCAHSPITGACDDGIECTTADACRNGQCRGDTSQCLCEPNLSVDGVKLTTVQIGADGTVGQGLDVDQNPATCAPANNCAAGIDNTLSILSGFGNDPLASAVLAGDVMLVVEFSPPNVNPVTVAVYQARLASSNAGCNFQTQTCDYEVDNSFLDPVTCDPIARLVGTRTGNRLVAGGPGTRLPFIIPFDGADLEVTINNLRIEVDLTVQGGQVSSLSGVLGGAVKKQTLIDALRQVPDDALPAPKEAIISLVETLVVNDVDTDGNGSLDAASIGVRIIAIDARLTGVAR
jgi:hypothetical protein